MLLKTCSEIFTYGFNFTRNGRLVIFRQKHEYTATVFGHQDFKLPHLMQSRKTVDFTEYDKQRIKTYFQKPIHGQRIKNTHPDYPVSLHAQKFLIAVFEV